MVTYITLAVLAVLILFIVLGLIAGFTKGVCKTTVKAIVLAVGVLIFVFWTPSITNAIGNIDLSSFDITVEINGTALAVSSLQQTLVDLISATNLISPINGLSIYQTAIALVNSVLSYVVFFVCVLLLQLFIWLINAIVYNAIFRWFLPVETAKDRRRRKAKAEYDEDEDDNEDEDEDDDDSRDDLLDGLEDDDGEVIDSDQPVRKKWKLHRGWGAVIGAVAEAFLLVVLVSPFSALLKTIYKNVDSVETALVSVLGEETGGKYADYLDEFYDSALFSMLNLTDLDIMIMDQVSQVEIGGQTVSFDGLLSSLVDVATPLVTNGSITYSEGTGQIVINYSILLSNTTVDALVESITANSMITSLLPAVIDIAVNSLTSDSLPLASLDLNNIDWSSELDIINSAYQELYETGLISGLFADDPYSLSLDSFSIDVSELTDDDIRYYVNALEYLGSLDTIEKNMPIVMSGIASMLTSTGFDIFPTDQAEYADIDWSHELGLLGDVALKLCRTLDLDISADMDTSSLTSDIVDSLKDQETRDEIELLINGDETVEGLLDLELMDCIDIPKVMNSVLTSVESIATYFEAVDFDAILGDFTADDLKGEISVLFDIVDVLYDPNAAIDLSDGLDIFAENFDFTDQAVCNELVDLLDVGEESVIYNSAFPDIMRSFIFNTDMEIEDYMFGLTPYDFNFESESFTSDLKELIELMPRLGDLMDLMNDSSASTDEIVKGLDVDAICDLLLLVAESDMFNSSKMLGITGYSTANINIYTVLNNLLFSDSLSDLGLSCPSISAFDDIDWKDEIELIADVLRGAQNNIGFLQDTSSAQIDDIESFETMLNSGLDSAVLSPSILEIVESSMENFLDEIGIHASLNDMRNALWKEDVDEIVDILLIYGELDFGNNDDLLNTLDGNTLNVLFTALYDTNFVTYCLNYSDVVVTADTTAADLELRKNENFSQLAYGIIGYCGLIDQFGVNVNSGLFSSTVWSLSSTESYVSSYNEDEYGNTVDNRAFTVTTSGDILALAEFYDYLLEGDLMDQVSGGKIPTGFLTGLPDSFYDSELMLKFMAECAYQSIHTLDIDPEYRDAIEYLNLSILTNLPASEVKYEFYVLQSVIDFCKETDENGDSLLTVCFDHVLNLYDCFESGSDVPDRFFSLLKLLGTSEMFTTISDYSDRSALAAVIYTILDGTGVGGNLTLLDYVVYYDGGSEKYISAIFEEVTDWEDEVTTFVSILENLQGVDDFTNILSDDNDGGVSEDRLKNIFSAMNESVIMHRIPARILSDYLEDAGFDSLLVDPDTGLVKYELDFDVALSMAPSDYYKSKLYWQNELDYMVDILFEFKSFLTTDSLSISDASFNDIDTSVIYCMGKMETFKYARSYIIYNLALSTVAIGDTDTGETQSSLLASVFITSELKPYGENQSVYRLEDLIFQNEKLMNEDGELDQELVEKDLTCVQEVLATILENIYSIGTADMADLASLLEDGFFETLARESYYFTTYTFTADQSSEYEAKLAKHSTSTGTVIHDQDGNITGYEVKEYDFTYDENGAVSSLPERSDFASELVAGVLKRVLGNDTLSLESLMNSFNSSSGDFSSYADVLFNSTEVSDEDGITGDLFFYDENHKHATMSEGNSVDTLIQIFSFFSTSSAADDETTEDESGSSYYVPKETYVDWIRNFNIAGLSDDWAQGYESLYTDTSGDSYFGRYFYNLLINIPFTVEGDDGTTSNPITVYMLMTYGGASIQKADGCIALADYVSNVTATDVADCYEAYETLLTQQ